MKNICFLNGDMSRSGGTERVTSIIANELCKNGQFNIHVLSTSNKGNKSFFELDEKVKQDRVLKDKQVNMKKQYFQVVKGIRQYIKQNDIDILIDVDVISDLFSIPATRFTKTKLVSWEHFHIYNNNGTKLRDIARKLAARYSDYIITLTEKDKNNYIEKFNIRNKIDYIYNPIIKADEVTCDINSKQIISVGMLRHVKGFDMLCDVANEVLHKHKDWKWIILGEGEDRHLLEEKIKKYNLGDKLILKGNVTDVDYYYKNSSIYVMTSRYEGLPMVLLEAKSNGLPIVSFDCLTGPSEMICDGINGYIIEPNNIEKMAEKINEIIVNDKKREMFSFNSNIDMEKFDMKQIIPKWIRILNNI